MASHSTIILYISISCFFFSFGLMELTSAEVPLKVNDEASGTQSNESEVSTTASPFVAEESTNTTVVTTEEPPSSNVSTTTSTTNPTTTTTTESKEIAEATGKSAMDITTQPSSPTTMATSMSPTFQTPTHVTTDTDPHTSSSTSATTTHPSSVTTAPSPPPRAKYVLAALISIGIMIGMCIFLHFCRKYRTRRSDEFSLLSTVHLYRDESNDRYGDTAL